METSRFFPIIVVVFGLIKAPGLLAFMARAGNGPFFPVIAFFFVIIIKTNENGHTPICMAVSFVYFFILIIRTEMAHFFLVVMFGPIKAPGRSRLLAF